MELTGEYAKGNRMEDSKRCDIWTGISNRYGLRFVGLRSQFYKMSA